MEFFCSRPHWSNPSEDYCPCDDPEFSAALEAGEDPCSDCRWCSFITD